MNCNNGHGNTLATENQYSKIKCVNEENIGRFLMKIKQNSLIQNNNLPSLSKWINPYKACIYGLCRDFL